MRVVFIGCVTSSETALSTLLALPQVQIAGVVTSEKTAVNADYCDIAPLIAGRNIPLHYDRKDAPKEALSAFIQQCDADYGLCIGWSRLLPNDILSATRHGVIGYHPTLLPKHRGRHPIIWAIALGLQETGSTLFLMDEGADSGPILSQRRIAIAPRETAGTLYQKLLPLLADQLRELMPQLAAGTAMPTPQNEAEATYWRKRSKDDGCIDWNQSADTVDRLVRALSPPYPRAHFVRHGKEWLVRDAYPEIAEEYGSTPGEILALRDGYVLVKCAQGMVWIAPLDPLNCNVGEPIYG